MCFAPWIPCAMNLGISLIERSRSMLVSEMIRAARLAGVAIEDMLDGTYPPEGVCPHCGQRLPASVALFS